jgi:hypothetical protein
MIGGIDHQIKKIKDFFILTWLVVLTTK